LAGGAKANEAHGESQMNAKAKGKRNEHRSMALLEAAGYHCTRSAGSLGEWDIIGPTDVVLCQVRTRDWPSTAGTLVVRRYCRKSETRRSTVWTAEAAHPAACRGPSENTPKPAALAATIASAGMG
jgi:hypothetical protein